MIEIVLWFDDRMRWDARHFEDGSPLDAEGWKAVAVSDMKSRALQIFEAHLASPSAAWMQITSVVFENENLKALRLVDHHHGESFFVVLFGAPLDLGDRNELQFLPDELRMTPDLCAEVYAAKRAGNGILVN